MEWLQPMLSTLGIIVSVLLTIVGYQRKVMSDQAKTLQALSILVQQPGTLQKLYAHILMEDPRAAAKERFQVELRVRRLEDLVTLLLAKKRDAKAIQLLIDKKLIEIQEQL
jgi:hypothetical protein